MWNEPKKERLARIPELYETENTPLKDKIVHLHFFIGDCDCYAVEFDGHDLFFGYVVLNNDHWNAEWGYFSLKELKEFKVGWLEVDCEKAEFWKIGPSSEIEKIKIK